jgi:hypothetical protein
MLNDLVVKYPLGLHCIFTGNPKLFIAGGFIVLHVVSVSATLSPSTGRREQLVHDLCVPCSYLSPDIYRD